MAIATLVSRAAGFARVLVVASALGLGSAVLDAYNVANTLPNAVFELVVGGAMASVVVPLLARFPSFSYAQRLLTLILYALSAITVAALVLAPWLVSLYTPGFSEAQRSLAVSFARFFLPQILFYGVSAVAGAVLSTRGRFAAPAWAPLANSLVVIVAGLMYLAVPSFTLLVVGTTAGVLAQMAVVLWALSRSGFPLRPRLDPRGIGLRRIARLGGWVLLSVAAAQALLAVATRAASLSGPGGVSAYQNALAVFQMPYAVIALSVMTAILPRLSRNAARRAHHQVTEDLSRAIRLAVAALAPIAAAMLVLGPQIATLLFAHGNSSPSAVTLLGLVIAAFGVALVPFTAYAILQRGFYALQDTRTPALITTGVTLVGVLGCLAAGWALPRAYVVVGVPFAYAIAYTAGLVASALILRRRLGRLDGHRLLRTHAKVAVAAGLAGLAAVALVLPLSGPALITLGAAAPTGAAVYLAVAKLVHLSELRQLFRLAV
ncbi:murein biosynthesis integral membrane protein MurJ [Actinoplanes sp. NPDC049596]|uniref:murein biosynthesis integral membrane protein MurJ n=1 Tax=unclassified Actinoplanes TaxID=2626549 RepID=UPI00341DA412